jgi:hypothetical protein
VNLCRSPGFDDHSRSEISCFWSPHGMNSNKHWLEQSVNSQP